jgi:predicted nucleotidyltransferase component of viral defense system
MNLRREHIATLATGTGFRAQALEKVIRLGEVLADINRHPLLSRVLALKGGTALNLFFGAPPRLSVDLDFNYIGHLDRAGMLEERPEVERALQGIAKGQGYQLQQSRDGHAGRKFYLGYRSTAGTQDRIEVDLNFLFRLPLGEIRSLVMWQPGDLERPSARVVPVAELFAGKLCALLDRVMPRDLFDVMRIPDHDAATLANPEFRKVFIALSATLDHPVYSYGRDRLERVTERIVSEQLAPMLNPDARVEAGELKSRAWSVVEPLVTLDDSEREYVEQVHLGQLHGELLFPDASALADRVNRHPALLWKIENVRRHRGLRM